MIDAQEPIPKLACKFSRVQGRGMSDTAVPVHFFRNTRPVQSTSSLLDTRSKASHLSLAGLERRPAIGA